MKSQTLRISIRFIFQPRKKKFRITNSRKALYNEQGRLYSCISMNFYILFFRLANMINNCVYLYKLKKNKNLTKSLFSYRDLNKTYCYRYNLFCYYKSFHVNKVCFSIVLIVSATLPREINSLNFIACILSTDIPFNLIVKL